MAKSPPDLSAMPLWVDLRGVPSHLYSQCGLRFLSSTSGKFVKLHPNTLRSQYASVGVIYPWLPPRCSMCHKWGHLMKECKDAEVRILKKGDGVKVGSAGLTTDGSVLGVVSEDVGHHEPLDADGHDWEKVTCHGRTSPIKESSAAPTSVDTGIGRYQQGDSSPSRFVILAGRDEKGELEEGEVEPSQCDEEDSANLVDSEAESVAKESNRVRKATADVKLSIGLRLLESRLRAPGILKSLVA
ncbi:unnamed protein product [Microthlaspi erraticum]|uniref:Uncharacterized protein n=1 Tax=Microthlaspi erraticum TaxID=1685480 RepID=A0A6D2LHW1_9BRAS|nr:unnamed protein product [Microthlaspi erraticum]